MPNEFVTSESGSGDPAVSSETPEDILEGFGIKAGTSSSDPLEDIKDKSAESSDPKEGTTPDSGSGKEGESKESKYADKYETPEALEKGYSELFKHKTTLESEAKDFRAKIAALEVQLSGKGEDKGTTPESKPGGNSEVYDKALETLTSILGEEAAQALLQISQTDSKATEELKTIKETVANLTNRELETSFYKTHPEAEEPEVQEVIQQMIKDSESKTDDPLYHMELLLDAAKGRLGEKHFAKRLEAIAKDMSKKDRDKLLAGSLSVGTNAAGSHEAKGKTDPKRAYELNAFFEDKLSPQG